MKVLAKTSRQRCCYSVRAPANLGVTVEAW